MLLSIHLLDTQSVDSLSWVQIVGPYISERVFKYAGWYPHAAEHKHLRAVLDALHSKPTV